MSKERTLEAFMLKFRSPLRALATGLLIAVLTAACGGGGSATTADASLGAGGGSGTGSGGSGGSGSGGSGASGGATISGSPSTTATVGQSYSFTPTSTGTGLTFSIQNKPSWASFNTSTGMLSGTPAMGDIGSDASITISVSNGSGSASLTAFNITVNQIATGSAVLSWTAPTQNTDGTSLTLSGYKILYGTSPTALTQSVSVSNPSLTTYTVPNLSSGTWYFAIVSLDSAGSQSVPTNVASATI
jgi:Putative Ig domain